MPQHIVMWTLNERAQRRGGQERPMRMRRLPEGRGAAPALVARALTGTRRRVGHAW